MTAQGRLRVVTSDWAVRIAAWDKDAVDVEVHGPRARGEAGDLTHDFDIVVVGERVEVRQLHAGRPGQRKGGEGCTIRVPSGLTVEVSTQSGDVTLGGALGPVNVVTATGTIDADGLGGDAVLRSGSGSVQVRLSERQEGPSVRAHTDTGRLAVSIPRDSAVAIAARSEDGTIEDGFGPARIYGHNVSLKRTVGSGKGGTIELSTKSGPLFIRPSDTKQQHQ
jgi:hypothetical protein